MQSVYQVSPKVHVYTNMVTGGYKDGNIIKINEKANKRLSLYKLILLPFANVGVRTMTFVTYCIIALNSLYRHWLNP